MPVVYLERNISHKSIIPKKFYKVFTCSLIFANNKLAVIQLFNYHKSVKIIFFVYFLIVIGLDFTEYLPLFFLRSVFIFYNNNIKIQYFTKLRLLIQKNE